jgi:hypothetical protein
MMQKRYFLVLFAALLLLIGSLPGTVQAEEISANVVQRSLSTADHSRFQELDRQFVSGPEVTKACLKCHNLAASQFHDTIHWTWNGQKTDKKSEGKVKTLNNF